MVPIIKAVIPAQAGIQTYPNCCVTGFALDSRLRGNDGKEVRL